MDIDIKPRIPCIHVLKSGKNKGYTCNKYNCKRHSGPICDYILKNENLCGRFNCKRHGNIDNDLDKEINFKILTIKDEADTCQICLDDFSEIKHVIKTHCNHVFHTECIKKWCDIKKWCENKKTCPLCRADIGSFC